MTDETRRYRTFLRNATNWEEFGRARKRTVRRNLTREEAQRMCAQFNDNRSPAHIKIGRKMEFESQ